MSVVGIDFGDESLTIAVARRQGIDVLQNDVGKRKTRSAISFTSTQRLVGDEAISHLMSNAANSIVAVKRLVGKMADDPDVELERTLNTTNIVADANGRAAIQLKAFGEDVIITPEQAVAALLAKLKSVYDLNNDAAGVKMRDCVIAIPGYFTDAQRRAMIDGAQMVGLNVQGLINEYMAVAIQYGIGRVIPDGELRRVIFYDMGYSATTAALVSFTKTTCKVEAVAFDRNLGGRNLDELLAVNLAKSIKQQYGLDVYSNTKALLKLRKECDRIKQTLSANTKVPYMIEYLMDGQDVKGMVTREEFEQMFREAYLERVLAPLHRIMKGFSLNDIHSMEILGGSTRVPCIQNALREFLGRELSKTCDGDESVCRGATFYCAMRSPAMKVRDYDFRDISPYSYQLEWASGQEAKDTSGHMADFTPSDKVVFLKARAPLPAVKSITIKETTLPLRVAVRFADAEDSEPIPTPNHTVALASITIPKNSPVVAGQTYRVRVKVRVDADRISIVSASALEEVTETVEPEVPATPTPAATDAAATPAAGDAAAPAAGEEASKPAAEGDASMTAAPAAETPAAPAPDAMADKTPAEPTTRKVVVERPLDWYLSSPFNLTDRQRITAHEADMKHVHADRLVRELAEMRNSLESYIFSMRNSATAELASYFPPGQADKFVDQLSRAELWLEDNADEGTKDMFEAKLEELKKIGGAAEKRAWEATNRPEAAADLTNFLNKWYKFINSSDENYAHITAEERAKAKEICDNAGDWLRKAQATQDATKAYDEPVLLVSDIRAKANEVDQACTRIFSKPKPAPKKAEKPKADEPAPANSTPGNDAGSNTADGQAAGAEAAGAEAAGAENAGAENAGAETNGAEASAEIPTEPTQEAI